MKIGYIVKPNSKGQIVIPQPVREALNLDKNSNLNLVLRDKAMYLYPIDTVNSPSSSENTNTAFKKVLALSQGAWANTENWSEWDANQDKKREKELETIKNLKNEW